ncbi:MAG: DnaJ domain-containing protein [Cyanothece sp. SIO1E1]|nr:DnaJ domain-containing protein [Cyanothece sp. SIO1E1]
MHTYLRTPALTVILTMASVCWIHSAIIEDDPYIWMEEVESEKALAWAKEISDKTTAEFEAVPEFEGIHAKLIEINNSRDRIPSVSFHGDYLYNFWQDPNHVRGIWRRTSVESYLTEAPEWETVLDIDALAEAEDENWVWKGVTFLPPEGAEIKVAYHRMARRNHPDRVADLDPEFQELAEQRMKMITAAYRTLSQGFSRR